MTQPERRKLALTDDDHQKIKDGFEEGLVSFCEKIGYDVSSPESRDAIRTDHKFVRYLRKGAIWIIGSGAAAYIGAAAAGWVP